MSLHLRFVALALIAGAAFGATRPSGEKGARQHLARLAAGQYHTCAVLDDGTVQCWGRNEWGQLGDGSTTTRLSPVPVANLGTTISVSAGAFHTCALSSSGAVSCWGLNDNGRLGTGSAASSSVPVALSGLTNVISISAGGAHTCAAKVDGSVWCWGAAIANGSAAASLVPVKVSLSGAAFVTAGGAHSCALMADASIQCWGDGTHGQLGDNRVTTSNLPVSVVSGFCCGPKQPIHGFVDVSAGGSFTCGRFAAYGTLTCWGENTFGQLGTGDTDGQSAVLFDAMGSTVGLSAGGAHACGLSIGGIASCFGLDDALQVGMPSGSINYIPTAQPVTGVVNAIEIAAGGKHSCAMLVDGTIRCWGSNIYGQHGDGTTANVGITSVAGIGGTFLGRGIAAGNQFPCARRGTGAVACWGAGTQGQLGNSASASSSNPVAVTGITTAVGLSAGSSAHECAIDAGGLAKCWGDNSRGQLGDGTTIRRNQPVAVFGGPYVAISTGDLHTCAVTQQATMQCWGAGDHGQLGNGGTSDSLTPVEIPLFRFSAVAAGGKFTCGVEVSGITEPVQCWGDNSAGQLGNGITGAPVLTPRGVSGPLNIVNVAAGASHVCALSGFGTLQCWGGNSRGQVGNNSTAPALFPTLVPGLTDAVSVSAGAFFTCAAQAGGTASCWGANDSGELSAIDSADHLTPTLVGTPRICPFCPGGRAFVPLSPVMAIATGVNPAQPTEQHACALLATGVVDCWGNNAKGEVGDGSTTNAPRPTVVNSFAANVDAAVAMRNTRIAEVTALIDCDQGDEAHIILNLEQGAASGTGRAEARCEGRLVRVPMTVPAQGPNAFQPGAATAHVEAIVRNDGTVVEDTHWTRQVVISIQ
jgi:alpha-tubulin suppressor-like RCC1 family protein